MILLVSKTPYEYLRGAKRSKIHRVIDKQKKEDVVIGVGGGKILDLAKKVGSEEKKKIVLIPSVLSTDTIYTPYYAVRRKGQLSYEKVTMPTEVCIDKNLLKTAGEKNWLGWADIFSCYTASVRLRRRHKDIWKKFLSCLNEARKDLLVLNETLKKEVELCNLYGDSWEDGVEHRFAFELEKQEKVRKKEYMHGNLVAVGIYWSSIALGLDLDYICGLMKKVGLEYDYEVLGIRKYSLLQAQRKVFGRELIQC